MLIRRQRCMKQFAHVSEEDMGGRSEIGSSRHRSLPEGVTGGTNTEVSWLRALTRLPGKIPVASE